MQQHVLIQNMDYVITPKSDTMFESKNSPVEETNLMSELSPKPDWKPKYRTPISAPAGGQYSTTNKTDFMIHSSGSLD